MVVDPSFNLELLVLFLLFMTSGSPCSDAIIHIFYVARCPPCGSVVPRRSCLVGDVASVLHSSRVARFTYVHTDNALMEH